MRWCQSSYSASTGWIKGSLPNFHSNAFVSISITLECQAKHAFDTKLRITSQWTVYNILILCKLLYAVISMPTKY